MTKKANQPRTFRRLARRYAPGLEIPSRYDRSWLPNDLGAGLSVADIALPIDIAYASLAGVPPVVGMYSAIFPLFAMEALIQSALPDGVSSHSAGLRRALGGVPKQVCKDWQSSLTRWT